MSNSHTQPKGDNNHPDSREEPVGRRSVLRQIGRAILDPMGTLRGTMGKIVGDDAASYVGKDLNYLRTVGETELLFIGSGLLQTALERYSGKKFGNANADEFTRRSQASPISFALLGSVISPIIEEISFRLYPALILDDKENDTSSRVIEEISADIKWKIGLTTSVLFALAHNIKQTPDGKLTFGEHIPLGLFLKGLYYWYLMRKRGVDHSIVAHVTNNATVWAIITTLNKLYPAQ